MKIMDEMDIDQIVYVPDTPDRLVKHGINWRNGVNSDNQRSPLPHNGEKMFHDEGSKDRPVIINSGSQGLSLKPPKSHTNNPKNSQCSHTSASFSLASSTSSRNANLYRKGMTEKKPSYQIHDSMHKPLEPVRPSYRSKSYSSSHSDGILDLTDCSLNEHACGNASSSAVPGKNQANFQKRTGLSFGTSSSHGLSNLANTSCSDNGEKRNPCRGGLSLDFGDRVELDGIDKKKPENSVLSPNLVAPLRVNRQKRLVRNGCISPNNIAKAKRSVGNNINGHNNGSAATEHDTDAMVNPPPVSIGIRDLVAEDEGYLSRKGKGVISHPSLSSKLDLGFKNMHDRSTVSPGQKAVESFDEYGGAGKSVEESVGWRSTHNRTRVTREMNNTSSLNKDSLVRERLTPGFSIQQHENRLGGRGKEISFANSDDFLEVPSLITTENSQAQSVKEPVSHLRSRPGRLTALHSAPGTLLKRQKQGFRLSSHGECSTSVSDDLVSSSSNLRSGSTNVNMPQIIEVDESSSQVRRDTHEDARARQLEADALMALELQEQFYNEIPAFGVPEGDGSNRGRTRGRPQVPDATTSNLHRQSRSFPNAPRRGALARSTSWGRMTRLRNRFPGQPRTLSSSQWRTSIFPPDMDIEMRMHILGALEEFDDIGMSAGVLDSVTNRDFTENDYEMLLALDDNNNRGGASGRQINGLPQSTLQSDLEEECAVCLETPTAGDIIRHLPCFHKFHKNCIDPWLRRKTSCPVCKSSVT